MLKVDSYSWEIVRDRANYPYEEVFATSPETNTSTVRVYSWQFYEEKSDSELIAYCERALNVELSRPSESLSPAGETLRLSD